MMTTTHTKQQGIALIFALIFLIVLSLLGVAASNVTSLEERMAGNTRDRDLAFQSAEAALQDTERDFGSWVTQPFDGTVAGLAAYDPTLGNDASRWSSHDWQNDSRGISQTIQQVAAPPRVYIEKLNPVGTTQRYRITARGVGGTDTAAVYLQIGLNYTP